MTIITGDCIEAMAAMEPESIDAVCTDPPYGLEFMGKEWDKLGGDGWRAGGFGQPGLGNRPTAWTAHGDTANATCATCGGRMRGARKCECAEPVWRVKGAPAGKRNAGAAQQAFHEAWAEAAFRVAKPGAYLLAFGGTRTVHRMTCAIEDAGWIIRDMLVWGYASGFPKGRANLKPAWEPIVMARKPGPLRPLAIDECRIPFVGDETPDDREGEATADTRYTLDGGTNLAAKPGRRIKSDRASAFPGGRLTSHGSGSLAGPGAAQETSRTEFAAEPSAAGRWPANVLLTSPIFDGDVPGVVGGGETTSGKMLPTVPTAGRAVYGADAAAGYTTIETYGDSGTYSRFFELPRGESCDWCGASSAASSSSPPSGRVGSAPSHAATEASGGSGITTDSPTTSGIETPSWHGGSVSTSRNGPSRGSRRDVRTLSPDPANNAARLATSFVTIPTTPSLSVCPSCADDAMRSFMDEPGFAEQPDSPRMLLIPKAARSDREPVLGEGAGRVVSVWGGDEDDLTPGKKSTIARRNHHPTVKPTDLMRHLVRLVTPQGGTVLDPFLGSGTTALAAEMEGFSWVGIEREAEYVAIAEARLNGTQRGMAL